MYIYLVQFAARTADKLLAEQWSPPASTGSYTSYKKPKVNQTKETVTLQVLGSCYRMQRHRVGE